MKFHLIGICGTGMASLAGLLKKAGHKIKGSDMGAFPPMSIQLDMLDIPVQMPYNPENLDWGPDVVVVGNVCRRDHVEVEEARHRNIKMMSMAETLETRFLKKRRPIVIAGTHGKTTSASMMAHLLIVAGRNPSYFIGGIPQNYGMSFNLGSGRDFVIEGDEYDTAFFDKESKFLHYRPKFVLLTGVEYDHADIFDSEEEVRATFKKFVSIIPETGTLVAHEDVPEEVIAAAKCRVHRYRCESESEEEDGFHGASPVEEGEESAAEAVVDKSRSREREAEGSKGQHLADENEAGKREKAGGGADGDGDSDGDGDGGSESESESESYSDGEDDVGERGGAVGGRSQTAKTAGDRAGRRASFEDRGVDASGQGQRGDARGGDGRDDGPENGDSEEAKEKVRRGKADEAAHMAAHAGMETGETRPAPERDEGDAAPDETLDDMDVVREAAGDTGESNVWTGRILKQDTTSGSEVFQLFSPDHRHLGTFRQTLAGRHNVLNAVGCLVLAHHMSLDWPDLAEGLTSFRGVQRRQEICGVAMGVTVIDDFAHHPTAVHETLYALRSRFKGHCIIAVFEPRSATSRRRVFQERFGEALSFADEVVVAKVHNADALPEEERLDPEELASQVRGNGTPARFIPEVSDIVERLAKRTRPGDIVVVMSSGSFGNIHHKLLDAIGDPIIRASLSDVDAMKNLLEPLDLVPHNLRAHFDEFLIIRGEEGLVGCVGLEARGRGGLIKSVALVPERRGEGLGFLLAQSALDKALDMGLSHVYLFGTENTNRIGQMLGFTPFPRRSVEDEMASSPEFKRPLHLSAELMRKDLSPGSPAPGRDS